jgi:hypothetical protein
MAALIYNIVIILLCKILKIGVRFIYTNKYVCFLHKGNLITDKSSNKKNSFAIV